MDSVAAAYLQQLKQALAGDQPLPADDEADRDVRQAAELIVPFVIEAGAVEHAPLVGAVPLGRPGAELVPVPGSERLVVVVDRQLPTLVHLVAKALAAALPTREEGERLHLQLDDDAWAATLASGHPAVHRYVEAIVASLGDGASEAPDYVEDPELEPVVSTLRQVIEWFEVAQPFAHVAATHHTTAARRPSQPPHAAFERFDWSVEQDHEAVARASMAVLNRARQTFGDVRLVAWALDAWLTTQMLLAGGEAVVKREPQEAFDQLTERPAERRAVYRAMLEQDEDLRPSLALVALLEPILEQFWEQSVQALMAAPE